MRVVGQVLAAYVLLAIMGVLWRHAPLGRAAPDVLALSAVYLGLTARHQLAPSMAGAVILGYLADLLVGSPRGMLALTAGVVCAVGHFIQGRLLVRGTAFTAVFSALTCALAGLFVLLLRLSVGLAPAGLGAELGTLALSALVTGLVGPLVFRIHRRVDARTARTQRERDAALEGLIP